MFKALLDTNVLASGKADYLVTGDGPLLRKVGNSYKGVTLISPKDFLEVLRKHI